MQNVKMMIALVGAVLFLVACEQTGDDSNVSSNANELNSNNPVAKAPNNAATEQSPSSQAAGDVETVPGRATGAQPPSGETGADSTQQNLPTQQQRSASAPPARSVDQESAASAANTDTAPPTQSTDRVPNAITDQADDLQAELEEQINVHFQRIELYEAAIPVVEKALQTELREGIKELLNQHQNAMQTIGKLHTATPGDFAELSTAARAAAATVEEAFKPFDEKIREALKARGVEVDW